MQTSNKRALFSGRPARASLLLVASMGIALLLGGCGNHNGQTTQNANQPGSSQSTTGVQNGGPAAGSSAGQNSSGSLQTLNNSINSSASSLNNDQNDANNSASQSQEQEQQP